MKGNIHYIRVGDYEIPDLKLPEETRSIGHWGRMHRDYLREYHPIRFNELILTGQLWTYLAGLNEQAQVRMETFYITTLIISKKPGNTGISRDIRTEFTTDLLLSD